MKKSRIKKTTSKDIINDLNAEKNKIIAANRARFMQSHKGGYGEGDLFFGLTVPNQRRICKKYYKEISLEETEKLLHDKFHESRYIALSILKEKYTKKKISAKEKEDIVKIYLRNTEHINNWDLVDISAPHITGEFWFHNPSKDMWRLAKSENLWKERISVLSTHYFIRNNRFEEILKLAEFFLLHKHDLMHKAVGWMLREVGKRNIDVLYSFLDKYCMNMPRTMLRYSIEKLPENKRKHYMGK